MTLKLSLTLLFFCAGFIAIAQLDTVHQHFEVSAQANVYYHALYNHDMIPGGVGIEPIAIDVREIEYISIEAATGKVSCFGERDTTFYDADGGQYGYLTTISGAGALSGIYHRKKVMFLCGVYTSSFSGLDEPYPPFDYTDEDDKPKYWPALNQVFYIGDGKTTNGTVQTFKVPHEAETLYIGFADALTGAPSNYRNNAGSINITVVTQHQKG